MAEPLSAILVQPNPFSLGPALARQWPNSLRSQSQVSSAKPKRIASILWTSTPVVMVRSSPPRCCHAWNPASRPQLVRPSLPATAAHPAPVASAAASVYCHAHAVAAEHTAEPIPFQPIRGAPGLASQPLSALSYRAPARVKPALRVSAAAPPRLPLAVPTITVNPVLGQLRRAAFPNSHTTSPMWILPYAH